MAGGEIVLQHVDEHPVRLAEFAVHNNGLNLPGEAPGIEFLLQRPLLRPIEFTLAGSLQLHPPECSQQNGVALNGLLQA